MPRIVTRAESGLRPPRATPTRVPLSARTATCVHHDGANPITVRTFAEACALIRKDQAFHMGPARGWNDIGYNFLVASAPGFPAIDGLIFEGRGRDVVGAHCLNWNKPWIGIQVAIGGGQTPSPKALASVRWLHDTFTTAAGHALGKKVHSDGFATACPDPKLRTWVHAGMPVTTPTTPTTPEDDMFTDTDRSMLQTAYKLLQEQQIRNAPVVAKAVAGLPALTAKAVVAALPVGGASGAPVDVAAIAKAVNDDAAKRLSA